MPNTTDDSNLEYIEIYNSGSENLNLEGYFIKDKSDKTFIFGSGETLEIFERKKYYRPETKILLNNINEDLFLYDNSGSLVDSFSYTGSIKSEEIKIIPPLAPPSEGGEANTGSLVNTGSTNTGVIINTGSVINYSDFELKYNFQNPSYILDKDILKYKYICDNSKQECKINLDLRNSFTGSFLEKDFDCEIDFGFNGWKNGEENKCNPGTIIYPKGEFALNFKISSKNDIDKIFTGSIIIENKIEPIIQIKNIEKIKEVEKIVEKNVCNSYSSSYGKKTISNQNIEKINIEEPVIIIQSGIKGGKCVSEQCSINLNYELKNSQEMCVWDFGDGNFKTAGTDKKCNPGYVKYGIGNYKVKLRVYQKGLESNFEESELEFTNSPHSISPIGREVATDLGYKKNENIKEINFKKNGIIINKILPNPEGVDDFEYIEIINNSGKSFDLKGCFIDDITEGGSDSFEIINSTILNNGDTKRFYKKETNINFNNSKDEANLICDNNLLDKLKWNFTVKSGYYLDHRRLDIKSSNAKVLKVTDGDTIEVQFLDTGYIEKIRLLGIDTPETSSFKGGVQFYGKQAKEFTETNLLNKIIYIKIDKNNFRDIYSRLLAFVVVDGNNFNEELVKLGYAKAYLKYDFENKDDFKKAEEYAKNKKIGIWSKTKVANIQNKKSIKDDIVFIDEENHDEKQNISEKKLENNLQVIKINDELINEDNIDEKNISINENDNIKNLNLFDNQKINQNNGIKKIISDEIKIKKIKPRINLQGKIGKNKVLNGNLLTCYDTCSINLDAGYSEGNIEEYSWDFGNGKTFKGENPGYVKYEYFGKYKVNLTVLGPNNIKEEKSFYVNYVSTKKNKTSKKSDKKDLSSTKNTDSQNFSKIKKVEIKNKQDNYTEEKLNKDQQIYGYILSFLIMLIVSLMGVILLQKRKII